MKRFISLFFSFVLLLTIVACSNDGTPADTEAQTSATTDTETAASTDAPAISPDPKGVYQGIAGQAAITIDLSQEKPTYRRVSTTIYSKKEMEKMKLSGTLTTIVTQTITFDTATIDGDTLFLQAEAPVVIKTTLTAEGSAADGYKARLRSQQDDFLATDTITQEEYDRTMKLLDGNEVDSLSKNRSARTAEAKLNGANLSCLVTSTSSPGGMFEGDRELVNYEYVNGVPAKETVVNLCKVTRYSDITITTYGEDGKTPRLIESFKLNVSGESYTLGDRIEHSEFDEEGNLTLLREYDGGGVIDREYVYYKDGSTKIYRLFRDGLISRETEYFENGEEKHYRHYANGVLEYEEEYDENGTILKQMMYDEHGNPLWR